MFVLTLFDLHQLCVEIYKLDTIDPSIANLSLSSTKAKILDIPFCSDLLRIPCDQAMAHCSLNVLFAHLHIFSPLLSTFTFCLLNWCLPVIFFFFLR